MKRVVEREEGEERIVFLLGFDHDLHLGPLSRHKPSSPLNDRVEFPSHRLSIGERENTASNTPHTHPANHVSFSEHKRLTSE